MSGSKVRFPDIIYWLAILGADLFIYIILGILQMDYEDRWDRTKGAFGSLASMNNVQLLYYFALQAWNIINILVVIYIVRRIYQKRKRSMKQDV